MAKGKSVNTADQPSKAWSSRANALTYNPGAQGTVSFGGSFKPETSNLKPGKLAMPQTTPIRARVRSTTKRCTG